MPSSSHIGSTNYELLKQLQNIDEHFAWEKFLRIYRPLIREFCRGRVLDSNEVDEVESMVMGRLLSFFTSRDGSIHTSFRGFLAKVVENEIREYHRERYRKQSIPLKAKHLSTLAIMSREDQEKLDEMESDIISRLRLMQDIIDSVRSQVDPKTWDIFWDYSIMGHFHGDVSAKYGVSKSSVFKYQKRISNKLRETAEKIALDEGVIRNEWTD